MGFRTEHDFEIASSPPRHDQNSRLSNRTPSDDPAIRSPRETGHVVDDDVAEIKKASIKWIDGLEHGFLDAKQDLSPKWVIAQGAPLVGRGDNRDELVIERFSRFDIEAESAERGCRSHDRGGHQFVMSKRSDDSGRPDRRAARRPGDIGLWP
jgi:hypothetical protein